MTCWEQILNTYQGSFPESKSAGTYSKPLTATEKNTVLLHAHRQPKFKEKSLISHVPNDKSLFSLYFTSLLSVPVFTETLRKYPILPFLDRVCCSDYELSAPNGNGTITLPAGTGVYIPVLALHHDPTYFSEPQKFDPDRFTEESKYSRPSYTYIPFGEGARMCIGKDRHLISSRKNFTFKSLTINVILLVKRPLSFWQDTQSSALRNLCDRKTSLHGSRKLH
jgi:hypothetical protein